MPKCDGCGKRIVWGIDPEGKRIPLDPTPPVYMVTGEIVEAKGIIGEMDLRGAVTVQLMPLTGEGEARGRAAMVSHFTTCPQRDRFSRRGQSTPSVDVKPLPLGQGKKGA